MRLLTRLLLVSVLRFIGKIKLNTELVPDAINAGSSGTNNARNVFTINVEFGDLYVVNMRAFSSSTT
jgi:hypothetical protein